jgi:hypothetical protein
MVYANLAGELDQQAHIVVRRMPGRMSSRARPPRGHTRIPSMCSGIAVTKRRAMPAVAFDAIPSSIS